jgi:hypothetical protein
MDYLEGHLEGLKEMIYDLEENISKTKEEKAKMEHHNI